MTEDNAKQFSEKDPILEYAEILNKYGLYSEEEVKWRESHPEHSEIFYLMRLLRASSKLLIKRLLQKSLIDIDTERGLRPKD